MTNDVTLRSIADDALLHRVVELATRCRSAEAELIAHLAEVDARRLYAREACPSMFAYCKGRLHFSEAEAYLRIAAARVSRQHPVVLDMLREGRLHLSAIERLAPHLTVENRDRVLAEAAYKSKREVEELVATLSPRADVAASIRKLPERRSVPLLPPDRETDAAQQATVGGPTPWSARSCSPTLSLGGGVEAGRDRAGLGTARAHVEPTARPAAAGPVSEIAEAELRPDGVRTTPSAATPRDVTTGRPARDDARDRVPAIQPLGPERYRIQFTAGAALRRKLERLRELMRPSVPDGDLAAIIEVAVTEKLERLEARRYGRRGTAARRSSAAKSGFADTAAVVGRTAAMVGDAGAVVGDTGAVVGDTVAAAGADAAVLGHSAAVVVAPLAGRQRTPGMVLAAPAGPWKQAPEPALTLITSQRYIPAAVRRAVWQRDNGRCRYADDHGRRCAATDHLEFHHRHPYGHGGTHDVDNLSLMCRAHNRYLAEIDCGRSSLDYGRSPGAADCAAGGRALQ